MAQHDFAPAWLNFPNPPSSSSKSSINCGKQTESFIRSENHYDLSLRRRNSSDDFASIIGCPNPIGGNFGRKEKNDWRSESRNGTVNINHGSIYNGAEHTRRSTFHIGKSPGPQESNGHDNKVGKSGVKGESKWSEIEDFPYVHSECEDEPNHNTSITASVWGLCVSMRGCLISLNIDNILSCTIGQLKFPLEYPLSSKSTSPRMMIIRRDMKDDIMFTGYPVIASSHSQIAKRGTVSSVNKGPTQNLVSHLTKSFEKPIMHTHHNVLLDRDVNRHFDERKVARENDVALTQKQLIQSSAFPRSDILSISLEAEHRLLKEMGWQEDSENDETCAPLTEDEMREFQVISEQLQKNRIRRNGLLKNDLACGLKFCSWKSSTFKTSTEKDDAETSSTDTSDDDV